MKRILLIYVWAGLLLCAAGIMTAQASSTIITFSVNMATNLANGSFNPPPPAGTGSDAVYVLGTFNGYTYPGLQLVEVGSSTIWTNSVNDTNDANGDVMSYIYDINYVTEATGDNNNRAAYLPTNSGGSLVLPTQYYGDIGPGDAVNVTFQVDMSEEMNLGHWNPTNGNTVVIYGTMNGWANTGLVLTNNPYIVVTNYNFPAYPNGLLESNVYTRTVPITGNSGLPGLPCTNSDEEWKYVEEPSVSWEN